jgi:hypothetical protein
VRPQKLKELPFRKRTISGALFNIANVLPGHIQVQLRKGGWAGGRSKKKFVLRNAIFQDDGSEVLKY